MNDEIASIFVRQRRNLMLMNLILVVADVSNNIHIGPASLHVHAPFTITTVLWGVWSYWVWRYYTSFHQLGDKGFLNTYRRRLVSLCQRIAIKMILADQDQYRILHNHLRDIDPNNKKRLKANNVSYGVGTPFWSRMSLVLPLILVDPTGKEAMTDVGWKPEVTVEGIRFFWAAFRAWGYVIIRTTLFSEYLLPFLLAGLTAAYGIYKYLHVS